MKDILIPGVSAWGYSVSCRITLVDDRSIVHWSFICERGGPDPSYSPVRVGDVALEDVQEGEKIIIEGCCGGGTLRGEFILLGGSLVPVSDPQNLRRKLALAPEVREYGEQKMAREGRKVSFCGLPFA